MTGQDFNVSHSCDYGDLSPQGKRIVEMYLTARQFKNAILEDEIIILPSVSNQCGTIEWGGTKVTFRGQKYLVRVFPFIVNTAFACEVYLKLLLMEQGFLLDKLKRNERHKLSVLFDCLDVSIKQGFFTHFSSKYGQQATDDFLIAELSKISDVFEKWRYIYEKFEDNHSVNYGFLHAFCKFLDGLSQKTILDNYNYDVRKNMR